MSLVLPGWIDQVPGVDFTPEKALLSEFEEWAVKKGWTVSDGSSLPVELRQRTDVLLTAPEGDRYLRIAVLKKNKGSAGTIRVDASAHQPFSHRVFELVYQPRARRWRLEAATILLSEDIQQEGWDLLDKFAFRQ